MQASSIAQSIGLSGIVIPVIVRSGFGRQLWSSGISTSVIAGEPARTSQLRVFFPYSEYQRDRDQVLELSLIHI